MNIFQSINPQKLMGYLIITEDGAVLASSGELENDEKISEILYKLINLTPSLDPAVFPKNSFQRITIAYEEFSYVICLSNRKFYVVKKKLT